jgi:hypothetical protein
MAGNGRGGNETVRGTEHVKQARQHDGSVRSSDTAERGSFCQVGECRQETCFWPFCQFFPGPYRFSTMHDM